jgi:hypothetical protein
VAAKHYAMPMQQSFQRAVVEGAKLDGLLGGAAGTMPQTAAGVLPKKVPLKVPQTFAETAGKRQPTKTAGTQNPAFGWGFLLPAVGVTLYSCPTRTAPSKENTGRKRTAPKSTPESTPQPVELFADAICHHLTQDEMQQLAHLLAIRCGAAPVG